MAGRYLAQTQSGFAPRGASFIPLTGANARSTMCPLPRRKCRIRPLRGAALTANPNQSGSPAPPLPAGR